MPIMTRMRESMPVILFGLLITFLITIIFEWGMDYLGIRGNRGDVVGKVDGTKITYRDFSDMINVLTNNIKAQTGKDPDDDQQKEIRDQAWQTIVTQHLIDEQIKRLGLTVTDQELIDWVRGPNPPEDLRRNFVDSTGQFRRDLYEEFLANPNQFLRDPNGRDPEYGTKWLANYEQGLRQRRLNEKLQSLIMASVRVSPGEVRQRFIDQNQKIDAAYAAFDASMVGDNDIQVTDADLKNYYDENIDQFKYEATRKLKYVYFQITPSSSDTSMVQKDIEDAATRARAGVDFMQLVSTYSDRVDSGAYFRHGELSPVVESQVFAAKVGDVVGPILDNGTYRLFKVLGERTSKTEYVRASHILLPVEGSGDTMAVKRQAEEIAREAKGGKDFAQLAREYSKDQSNAARGGDLGWFTHGRMVPSFEAAVFKARVGEVVGPVRTPYGWHIIKVTGRDNRELKLVSVNIHIEASSQTKNDLLDRARDFAANCRETDFMKEVQQTGLEAREAMVQDKSTLVPGLGINEPMTKWAFDAKLNEISDPFTLPAGYVVATVAEIKPAGVRPFDEVKESLRPAVLRKKKIQRAMEIARDARAKLAPGDSLSVLEKTTPGIRVGDTGPFTADGSIPGIGRDPAFLGAAEVLQPGIVSNPVEGQRGAYLIKVLSRTPFDSSAFAQQRESLELRMVQDKKSKFLNDWLTKLRDRADIEDHRDLFFR
jgi:peptidyl-prolyl cis-trans isomerase D